MGKDKEAPITREVKIAKDKVALDGDIQSFFGVRDKTNRGADGLAEDVAEISKAEMKTRQMLFDRSMKCPELDSNITPMFNSLFLSAKRNNMITSTGIILSNALDGNLELEYNEEQIVMAVGPNTGVEKGWTVVVNFANFMEDAEDGMRQVANRKKKMVVPIITIDEHDYMHVSERDLSYIKKKS